MSRFLLLVTHSDEETGVFTPPTEKMVQQLWMDVQQFQEVSAACHHVTYQLSILLIQIFSKETEHFAGETLLAKQEVVKSLAELVGKYDFFKMMSTIVFLQVEQWTDIAMKMLCRHQIDSTAEEFEMMRNTNANIDQLLAEYGIRVSGENGIATSFLHLLTPMETWYELMSYFSTIICG